MSLSLHQHCRLELQAPVCFLPVHEEDPFTEETRNMLDLTMDSYDLTESGHSNGSSGKAGGTMGNVNY